MCVKDENTRARAEPGCTDDHCLTAAGLSAGQEVQRGLHLAGGIIVCPALDLAAKTLGHRGSRQGLAGGGGGDVEAWMQIYADGRVWGLEEALSRRGLFLDLFRTCRGLGDASGRPSKNTTGTTSRLAGGITRQEQREPNRV